MCDTLLYDTLLRGSNMKTKWFIVICLVLLAGSPVFAANAQKVFPTDSEVYEAISLLYINQGISLPSGSGPRTSD